MGSAATACSLTYLYSVKISRIIRPFVAVGALATVAACSSPTKPVAENGAPSPASAAEMALMARHDSLMAQTDQLYTLKGKLSGYHTEAAAPYIHGLLAADAAMMAWMHQYKAPDSTVASATRLAYFQEQQQVLAGVRRQFRTALDSARQFTTQHPAAGDVRPPSSH